MTLRVAFSMARVAAIALVAVAATPPRTAANPVPPPPASKLPPSAMSVWTKGNWQEWWRSDAAPERWRGANSTVADAVQWRSAAEGVDWGELRLAGVGEAKRLRAVVVRIDPRLVTLRLDTAFTARGERASWTVDAARDDAIVALNAGQFIRTQPWGWVVLDGREYLTPGTGPLSTALAVDSSGIVHWIGPTDLASPAARRGFVAAFQSYPTLLDADGEVPAPLREPGRGIDVEHRDARLGIGALPDGRLLIVLTRFDALGESLGLLPFGPTIPEFAALMGALGARRAVALDGGISGQLLIRDANGTAHMWRGLRKVPLALVALPKR